MNHLRSYTTVAGVATAVAAITVADARARNVARDDIPVRSLTVSTVSSDSFGAIVNVRQLTGGRLLVNDAKRHRILMLDSALRLASIVFDSTTGRGDSYGSRPEPLIPYLGDSSIFVDATSQAMILITPEGRIGRVISAPNDPGIWTVATAAVGVDEKGRLLYNGLELRHGLRKGGPLSISMAGMGAAPVTNADSLPIIRGDFQTRHPDTIAALLNFGARRIAQTDAPGGGTIMTTYVNPLANGDAWTVMSDGTIAIVRGHDYHIDWITSNNKKTSTEKLPFDWKRVTDEDKNRLRDSTVAAMARADSVMQAMRAAAASGAPGEAGMAPVGVARGGGGGGGRGGGGGEGAPPPGPPPIRRTEIVANGEMPDYIPPIRASSARGDRDNNLWILPTTSSHSAAGELVYDVVNRKGELFQRVRLPLGRSIVGFGRNGVVYLVNGDLKSGFLLERAVIAGTSSD